MVFIGRGSTGKTMATHWMSERAMRRPDDADDPATTPMSLEGCIQHAIRQKVNVVVDLGGSDLHGQSTSTSSEEKE